MTTVFNRARAAYMAADAPAGPAPMTAKSYTSSNRPATGGSNGGASGWPLRTAGLSLSAAGEPAAAACGFAADPFAAGPPVAAFASSPAVPGQPRRLRSFSGCKPFTNQSPTNVTGAPHCLRFLSSSKYSRFSEVFFSVKGMFHALSCSLTLTQYGQPALV